jgi:hypothetical protein
MKNNTFSDKAMTVVSLTIMLAIVVSFFWLWFGYKRPTAESFKSLEDLTPVSLSNLESRATTLLSGLKNNSGIPIPEPTSKEGRTDPFADL